MLYRILNELIAQRSQIFLLIKQLERIESRLVLPTLSVDNQAGAMYIKIKEGCIEETEEYDAQVYFDRAKDGSLIGIEIIFTKIENQNRDEEHE